MFNHHNLLKRILTLIGRGIEFLLTGESDYKFLSSDIANFEYVADHFKAKMLIKEVREFLFQKFGIEVNSPVVLEFFTGREWDWNSARYHLGGSLGRYYSQSIGNKKVHFIYILKGLARQKFKSIFAHEYTHAFQREKKIFPQSKGLREGLARWVEYKILLEEGAYEEAKKLLGIRHWIHGKGLKKILEMERKYGELGLIENMRRLA